MISFRRFRVGLPGVLQKRFAMRKLSTHAADSDEADRETCRVPILPVVLVCALAVAILWLFRYSRF
jgi:hypothetical protein